jgi:iron complex outermembrane receptor protein
VRVAHPGGQVDLVAGQHAIFPKSGASRRIDRRVLAPDDIDRALAWRDGRLDLAGEPLESAVAEINRHSRLRVHIADAALAREPLYGSFRLDDATGFARAAAASLGVPVHVAPDRIVIGRPAAGFSSLNRTETWKRFTPRAVVEATPRPNLLAYASFARGYTAGGFNTEAAVASAFTSGYAPETVDSYEAGLKSEWLDRRLRLNVSAFRMRYHDKQEIYFDNVTRILNIYNAAKATSKGVEVELQARPTSWLKLGATYGHLDTRYDDFVIPGGLNNTGNRLGSAPRHKASLTANLDVPAGELRVVGNAVYSYTSGYYTGATADPGLYVPGYSLVNGQFGVATLDGRLRLSVFARNLLDKDYLLIPSTQVVRAEYLGEPRTIGVTASFRFQQ